MIASEIVKPSREKDYVIGSRGIAFSIVLYFLNITEMNSVAPHYYCEKCGYAKLNDSANCGCDLPDKICPECGQELLKDGFNVSAEIFMGTDGNRESDIDFNFAPEIWDKIVAELKEMFGENHIVRTETIAQISEKLARHYLEKYCNEKEIVYSSVKENEYIRKLQNVKRITHNRNASRRILDYSARNRNIGLYYNPASGNNVNIDVVTIHFDNWSLLGSLFKLDVLMHDTQSMPHGMQAEYMKQYALLGTDTLQYCTSLCNIPEHHFDTFLLPVLLLDLFLFEPFPLFRKLLYSHSHFYKGMK